MWLVVFTALHLGPWVESEEVLQGPRDGRPGIGLRVESDRPPWFDADRPPARPPGPDDGQLARADDTPTAPGQRKATDAERLQREPNAGRDNRRTPDASDGPGVKKRDYRPPRDKAADRMNDTERTTRPVFVSRNQQEVARAAEALGKPVVWWTFWPDTYDNTAAYFNELGEAQHVLMTPAMFERWGLHQGDEWIVYKHKDGEPRWIRATEVSGAECAAKLRAAWAGQKGPQPTEDDHRALLATSVKIRLTDGAPEETLSLGECIRRGYRFTYADGKALERKGLSEDEVKYLVSQSQAGPTGAAAGYATASGRSAGYAGTSLSGSRPASYSAGAGYQGPTRSADQALAPATPSRSVSPPIRQAPPPASYRQPAGSFQGPLRGG